MKFLQGSRESFDTYFSSLTSEDKVALISHTDLDGVSSAVFMTLGLRAKGIEPALVRFINITPTMLREVLPDLSSAGITHVIITDLNVDGADSEGFSQCCSQYQTLLIDHHPYVPGDYSGTILKNSSWDCTGYVTAGLVREDINWDRWEWLMHCAIITDHVYTQEDKFSLLEAFEPGISQDNPYDSPIGKKAQLVGMSLYYYVHKERVVYDAILQGDIQTLYAAYKEIDEEVAYWEGKYLLEQEFFEDIGLHFFSFSPKHPVKSIVSGKLSDRSPEEIFVFLIPEDEDYYSVSSRCQSGRVDLGALLKEVTSQLSDATGGGHARAAGARFLKKDLEVFKEKLLLILRRQLALV